MGARCLLLSLPAAVYACRSCGHVHSTRLVLMTTLSDGVRYSPKIGIAPIRVRQSRVWECVGVCGVWCVQTWNFTSLYVLRRCLITASGGPGEVSSWPPCSTAVLATIELLSKSSLNRARCGAPPGAGEKQRPQALKPQKQVASQAGK